MDRQSQLRTKSLSQRRSERRSASNRPTQVTRKLQSEAKETTQSNRRATQRAPNSGYLTSLGNSQKQVRKTQPLLANLANVQTFFPRVSASTHAVAASTEDYDLSTTPPPKEGYPPLGPRSKRANRAATVQENLLQQAIGIAIGQKANAEDRVTASGLAAMRTAAASNRIRSKVRSQLKSNTRPNSEYLKRQLAVSKSLRRSAKKQYQRTQDHLFNSQMRGRSNFYGPIIQNQTRKASNARARANRVTAAENRNRFARFTAKTTKTAFAKNYWTTEYTYALKNLLESVMEARENAEEMKRGRPTKLQLAKTSAIEANVAKKAEMVVEETTKSFNSDRNSPKAHYRLRWATTIRDSVSSSTRALNKAEAWDNLIKVISDVMVRQ